MTFLTRLAATGLAALMATTAMAADPIKIGFITPKSGPLKGPGEPAGAALAVALEEINAAGGVNGHPIEIVEFDSSSDPKQASLAVRSLARDEGVVAIIGPFSSGEFAVASNIAEREQIVSISNASSAPGLTEGKSWAFRMTEDEGKQFSRLMVTLEKLDLPREDAEIVYVADERVANVVGTAIYPAIMGNAGIKVGEPVSITYKSFDLAPQIAPIIEKNPDLVAVAGLPENAAKTIRELKRQGYEGRMIGSQIFSDPLIVELFGDSAEGTTMMAGFHKDANPAATAFDAAFIAKAEEMGIRKLGAHHSDAQTYDTLYLLKQVMEDKGVTPDTPLDEARTAIRDGLAGGVTFTGVLGEGICFVGQDAELPGYVITIEGGAWTLLDTHPADACPSS